jgi:chromosome partitioning protein
MEFVTILKLKKQHLEEFRMRRICVINQKGGVGKTTTAINLAAGLALKDKKVLLIDLDPQGSTTFSLDGSNSQDLYDYLTNNVNVSECVSNLGKNLDILGTKENLAQMEQALAGDDSKVEIVTKKLNKIENYDYIIFDTAPSLSIMNKSVLLASNEAIIPTATDVLGLRGTTNTIKLIEQVNKDEGHDLKITKIIPTLFDKRNNICKKILEIMNNIYYDIISDPIRINSKLKEAPEHHKSIFTYDKRSRGAEDYKKLTVQVINDERLIRKDKAQPVAVTA